MAKSFAYAGASFIFIVALLFMAILFGGGGHGTALFGLVALSPGSIGGDNEASASGILFWPLVGFLLAQTHRRGIRPVIILLMLFHYAVAGMHLLSGDIEVAQEFAVVWRVMPVQIIFFCIVYLAGNLVIWALILRKAAIQS